jgi:hypothetical protein
VQLSFLSRPVCLPVLARLWRPRHTCRSHEVTQFSAPTGSDGTDAGPAFPVQARPGHTERRPRLRHNMNEIWLDFRPTRREQAAQPRRCRGCSRPTAARLQWSSTPCRSRQSRERRAASPAGPCGIEHDRDDGCASARWKLAELTMTARCLAAHADRRGRAEREGPTMSRSTSPPFRR